MLPVPRLTNIIAIKVVYARERGDTAAYFHAGRHKTGVERLDEILENGLPRLSTQVGR